MDELQAGIEPAFTILPQPPVFFQPCKAALDHPALWHDLEGVQLTALGYLHCEVFTQRALHALRKGLAYIAAVTQQALYPCEAVLATRQRL